MLKKAMNFMIQSRTGFIIGMHQWLLNIEKISSGRPDKIKDEKTKTLEVFDEEGKPIGSGWKSYQLIK